MAFSLISAKVSGFISKFGRFILVAAFGMLFVAALVPDIRSTIRAALLQDFRNVISTVHGDITGDGLNLIVAKVRTRDSLLIEIYHPQEDGSQKLLARITLPDKNDGFFNFNGQATNLALDDIDGDGFKEIIVPTFDQNMVGQLHIYRYDAASNSFYKAAL